MACASCPWRRSNHGKRHPAKWYTMANLKRLWNGVRTGRTPGMVCHSTDPDSPQYGSEKPPPPGAILKECDGMNQLIQAEIDAVAEAQDLRAYRSSRLIPFNRHGLATQCDRIISNEITYIHDPEVSLPWKQEKQ